MTCIDQRFLPHIRDSGSCRALPLRMLERIMFITKTQLQLIQRSNLIVDIGNTGQN